MRLLRTLSALRSAAIDIRLLRSFPVGIAVCPASRIEEFTITVPSENDGTVYLAECRGRKYMISGVIIERGEFLVIGARYQLNPASYDQRRPLEFSKGFELYKSHSRSMKNG